MTIEDTISEGHEDNDMEKPQEPIEPLHEKKSHKRKPAWAQELIQDVEGYGTTYRIHRERKRPKPYNIYVALLCDIIDKETSNYE